MYNIHNNDAGYYCILYVLYNLIAKQTSPLRHKGNTNRSGNMYFNVINVFSNYMVILIYNRYEKKARENI
jgi:hypothetical protein